MSAEFTFAGRGGDTPIRDARHRAVAVHRDFDRMDDRASRVGSDIKSNYIAHRDEEPHELLFPVLFEGNTATFLHL